MDSLVINTISSFPQMFEEIKKRGSEKNAFCFQRDNRDVSVNYKEFCSSVEFFSSWCISQGYAREHIALVSPNSYEWLVTYFGVSCSDNVIVPIDRKLPTEGICDILNMSDSTILFLADSMREISDVVKDKCKKVKEIYIIENDFLDKFRCETIKHVKIDPDNVNTIIYTSGTTGMSKGVMLSQTNFISGINAHIERKRNMKENIELNSVLSILPYHHVLEFSVITIYLMLGMTIYINSDMKNFVAELKKYNINGMCSVPALVEAMYKTIRYKISQAGMTQQLDSLLNSDLTYEQIKDNPLICSVRDSLGTDFRFVIIGGAKVSAKYKRLFNLLGIIFWEGYGMTECAPTISTQTFVNGNQPGCGIPLKNVQVRTSPDGEILVKGPNVMLGYYRNPAATKDTFDADGWLKTGDLGEIKDGNIFLHGRSKNLIILPNGKNIYPEEYEARFSQIEGVKDVVVIEHNNQITAVVLPYTHNDKTIKTITDSINAYNAKIPPYMRVTDIIFRTEEFKKTTAGKIIRRDLSDLAAESVFVEPSNDTEEKICKVISDVMEISKVSVTDNFFALGGDSLSAVIVASSLGIQPQTIYENPVIRDLALEIQSARVENIVRPDVNSMIASSNIEENDLETNYILLTGSTGFLGAHILKELTVTGKRIACLVRSRQKFEEIQRYYFGDSIDLSNVKLIIGNIEKPLLGLTEEEYAHLTRHVDTVFHIAANVQHVGNYENIKLTNVTGTKNIIELCMKSDAVLHYASTAYVSGMATVAQSNHDCVFDENVLNIGQHFYDNVYIHSKYHAEETVLIARKDGLKANIYRIGNLTWRKSDGRFQKNAGDNGFVRRISAVMKMGCINDELNTYPVDLTPVDECAKAFTLLALNDKINAIYHLYNPNTVTTEKLVDLYGKKLRKIPLIQWKKKLENSLADKDIRVLAFYMKMAEKSDPIVTKSDYTVKQLSKMKFRWSDISPKYLSFLKLSNS
ncbi:MAG: AMP-binding protein [Oscillospiraceae bacterium]|nr:AMP-binding protein [Oscillospiraceae bacterium]